MAKDESLFERGLQYLLQSPKGSLRRRFGVTIVAGGLDYQEHDE